MIAHDAVISPSLFSKVILSDSDASSPCAKDSYDNVAIEMHNSFLKNVVSTDKALLEAISMARFGF